MAESRVARLLIKRLEEELKKNMESLAEGAAVDFPAYKDMVGYMRGLRDASALCEEIDKGIE